MLLMTCLVVHVRSQSHNWNIFKMLCTSNILCNLHTISNNCAKYEHPWSKNEGGVQVTSHKLIKSIFDLDF